MPTFAQSHRTTTIPSAKKVLAVCDYIEMRRIDAQLVVAKMIHHQPVWDLAVNGLTNYALCPAHFAIHPETGVFVPRSIHCRCARPDHAADSINGKLARHSPNRICCAPLIPRCHRASLSASAARTCSICSRNSCAPQSHRRCGARCETSSIRRTHRSAQSIQSPSYIRCKTRTASVIAPASPPRCPAPESGAGSIPQLRNRTFFRLSRDNTCNAALLRNRCSVESSHHQESPVQGDRTDTAPLQARSSPQPLQRALHRAAFRCFDPATYAAIPVHESVIPSVSVTVFLRCRMAVNAMHCHAGTALRSRNILGLRDRLQMHRIYA